MEGKYDTVVVELVTVMFLILPVVREIVDIREIVLGGLLFNDSQ